MSNSFWASAPGAAASASPSASVPAAVSLGLFPRDNQVAMLPMMTAAPGGGTQVQMQRVETPILVGRIPTTAGACASCADSLRPGGLVGLCGGVDRNGRYGEHTFVKCQPPTKVFNCYYEGYEPCGSVLQGAQTAAYSSAPYDAALRATFDQSEYLSAVQTFFASLNRV